MDYLNHLPDNVAEMVLKALKSPQDVMSSITASRKMLNVYQTKKEEILWVVIQEAIGYEALQDALAVLYCPRLEIAGPNLISSRYLTEQAMHDFELDDDPYDHWPLNAAALRDRTNEFYNAVLTGSFQMPVQLAGIQALCSLYCKIMPFVGEYASEAYSRFDRMHLYHGTAYIMPSERKRLLRAFFRFEWLTRLVVLQADAGKLEDLLLVPHIFSISEIMYEEIASVYNFALTRIESAFANVRVHAENALMRAAEEWLQTHPPGPPDGIKVPIIDETLRDEEFAHFSHTRVYHGNSTFHELTMFGLGFMRQVITAEEAWKLNLFLDRTLEATWYRGFIEIDSSTSNRTQTFGDPNIVPFFFVREDPAGEVTELYGQDPRDEDLDPQMLSELRRSGLIFWDPDRVEEMGQFTPQL